MDGNTMNSTVKLLKAIGSPFVNERRCEAFAEEEVPALYLHAIKNRIPLLYLDTLNRQNKLFDLKPVYCREYSRYLKIFDTMAEVSDFLSSLNVEHVIFKSIRPYPDASVDIDTLIFDSEKYERALKSFLKTGWNILGYGPQSATFFDSEAQVGIDLYREIAVSWVIYLDKRKLEKHIVRIRLPNNKYVSTLQPEADLVAIIAHSVIKEQVYTMAEFYTFLKLLKMMKRKEVENLIELIRTDILVVAKSFISVTLALHKEAFGFIPEKLAVLSSELGREGLEENRLAQSAFHTPHKYHYLTLVRSLMGKLKEEKTRKSMAMQGFKMMDLGFTRTVVAGIVDHMTRETY